MRLATTPIKQASAAVKAIFADERREFGGVTNIARLLSLEPAALQAYRAIFEAVHRHEDDLDLEMRQVLAAYISRRNQCEYCVVHHTRWLLDRGYSEETLDAILDDYRTSPVERRTKELLTFADLVNEDPHLISEVHIQRLRAVGFSDRAVLMAAFTVASYKMLNTLVTTFDVPLEK